MQFKVQNKLRRCSKFSRRGKVRQPKANFALYSSLDSYPIPWKSSSAIHSSGNTHHAAEEPNVEDLEKYVLDGSALRVSYRIVHCLVPESEQFQVHFKPLNRTGMGAPTRELVYRLPVKRDRTQVENGGRAAEDVEGEPSLADEAAEHPP